MMIKKQKGFSLIELLIVVAIILIIAAIAIPNLLRSKMAANEASAVGSLRTITTASVTYSSTYGNGFPPSLGSAGGAAGLTVADCQSALLVDSVLSGGGGTANVSQKSGYSFTYTPINPNAAAANGCTAAGANDFVVNAVPITLGSSGQRSFCTDESGVIRFDSTGATAATTEAGCAALTALQ
jgi:prepilin-type N-terminal cleavage/methylation domain-containing protein